MCDPLVVFVQSHCFFVYLVPRYLVRVGGRGEGDLRRWRSDGLAGAHAHWVRVRPCCVAKGMLCFEAKGLQQQQADKSAVRDGTHDVVFNVAVIIAVFVKANRPLHTSTQEKNCAIILYTSMSKHFDRRSILLLETSSRRCDRFFET